LQGHWYAIRSLAFSPDGSLLVSADDDAQVRYWDAKGGSMHKVIAGHSGPIWSLALSRDGSTLATASSDKTIKLWDPREVARPVSVAPHPGPVTAVAFLPDSKTLVTPGWDSRLPFWDADTGAWKSALAVEERVAHLALSHVRSLLAVGTIAGRVHLYDLAQGNRLVTSLPHEQPIGLVAISPDGTHLAYQFSVLDASGGFSHQVTRLWDLASGSDIFNLRAREPVLTFSPDGKNVTILDDEGILQRFDLATRPLDATPLPELRHPSCLAYAPDAKTLAIGSVDRSIRLYDPETGQERATLLGHRDPVNALAFSPDGRTLASGSKAGELHLWDVFTGQQLIELHGHPGSVVSLVFSPDGARLAAGGVRPDDHGEVTIWHSPRRNDK
jgi:WD40 repeat protein